MRNYETPEPISVTLELNVGDVRIAASDRTDTVVEIHPSDAADESDVKAAQQICVDYTNGMLRVIDPKARSFNFFRKTKSVDVSIELPSGSQLSAAMMMGDFHSAGQLGETRLKTTGNVRLERTGTLHLLTGMGHVTADGITGNVDISTGSGKIRIGEIKGTAVVKTSNGSIEIDAVTGDARVCSANGDISVERAGNGVDAKTANGNIRLGEVVRGSVVLGTAAGNLEVGIAQGTAAWLEVNTVFGNVRNLMNNTNRPEAADETVEVRGRTAYGDITIHRS